MRKWLLTHYSTEEMQKYLNHCSKKPSVFIPLHHPRQVAMSCDASPPSA